MAKIRVRLAPGRNSYFDPITKVYLQSFFIKDTIIDDTLNLTNINTAVASGALELVSGTLPPLPPIGGGGGGVSPADLARLAQTERQPLQMLIERFPAGGRARYVSWDGLANTNNIDKWASDSYTWSNLFRNEFNDGGYVKASRMEEVMHAPTSSLYGGLPEPPVAVKSSVLLTNKIVQTVRTAHGGSISNFQVFVKAPDAPFDTISDIIFTAYDSVFNEIPQELGTYTVSKWRFNGRPPGEMVGVSTSLDFVLTPGMSFDIVIESTFPYEVEAFDLSSPDIDTSAWDYTDGYLSTYNGTAWNSESKDLWFYLRVTGPEKPAYNVVTVGLSHLPATAKQFLLHTHEDFLGYPEPHVFAVEISFDWGGTWMAVTPGTWTDLPDTFDSYTLKFKMGDGTAIHGWAITWRD